jgi:hypothetical protein
MKNLIKKLLRESLIEAFRGHHWINDTRYMERISDEKNFHQNKGRHDKVDYDRKGNIVWGSEFGVPFNNLTPELRKEIDKRLKYIESLEFIDNDVKHVGIWAFRAPYNIKHFPFNINKGKLIDQGDRLLVIIDNNEMMTLIWRHNWNVSGDWEGKTYTINYDDLVDYVNSGNYDPKTKPIDVKSLSKWKGDKFFEKEQDKPKPNLNRFSRIKLSDGQKIRYYFNVTDVDDMFKTLDGKLLNVDDIFDELPEDIQNKLIMENKKMYKNFIIW